MTQHFCPRKSPNVDWQRTTELTTGYYKTITVINIVENNNTRVNMETITVHYKHCWTTQQWSHVAMETSCQHHVTICKFAAYSVLQ